MRLISGVARVCMWVHLHLIHAPLHPPFACVKPGNKNQKLGTLGDFEFVVDYASMISLDTVFKIS